METVAPDLIYNETQVRVNIPNYPTIIISYEEKFGLLEYCIYVMSCFGTWLGISMVNLNPVTLLEWIHKHRQKGTRILYLRKSVNLEQLSDSFEKLSHRVNYLMVQEQK